MRVPPGVAPDDFKAALKEFEAAVGAEWVFTSDEDVALYRDAYSPLWGEAEEKVASAAVAPDRVEQVQQIVRIANRYKIPIYTISTGRNLAYGGSAPAYSGSVVLDLKRMNKVIEVNEKNAYALVEPGVSYFDLYRHIREKGLKLWIDCPDPGWGSPVGNALDHGAGYTPLPFRDHFDAHCGMEVVLANGDIVRTGMGALPAAETWQQFKYGIGPFVDGIFSQSNLGIVTKMGFWLYPEPRRSRAVSVRVQHHDDVIPLVATMANLMYAGVINCHIGITSHDLQRGGRPRRRLRRTDGQARWRVAAEMGRLRGRQEKHFWQTELHFYGPAKVIAAQWEHAKEKFSTIKGVEFEDGISYRFPLTDEQVVKVGDRLSIGIPSLGIYSSLLALPPGTSGHMDLSPILPMTGEAILEAHRVFSRAWRDMDVIPLFAGATSFHWRSFIMFNLFPVTSRRRQEQADPRGLRGICSGSLPTMAGGVYRTHTAFMDEVMDTYSYNDHALPRLHQTLKDALDPNGILSAGRYGIWPKHLREKKP